MVLTLPSQINLLKYQHFISRKVTDEITFDRGSICLIFLIEIIIFCYTFKSFISALSAAS